MSKKTMSITVAVAALISSPVLADAGDWLLRARLIHIDANSSSDAGGPLGLPADAVKVGDRLGADLDISYFFTDNIAAELVLTYPQRHKVTLNGADIGAVKHIPPTLVLRYHFPIGRTFKPYVGAGVNLTVFTDRTLLNGLAKLERTSFGPAVQLGLDYAIDKHWSLNVDVKKIFINSDVEVAGVGKATELDIDPWVYGVGYRY